MDRAPVGPDVLHRGNKSQPRGGIRTYAVVYRWFSETIGLGLAEQTVHLRNPKAANKDEYIAIAIEK